MDEVKNTDIGTAEETTAETKVDPRRQEKKYSDIDVDGIVARKLAKQKEQLAKQFAEQQQEQKKVSELDERERNIEIRERKADARDEIRSLDLPDSALEVLDCQSDEAYKKSLKALQGYTDDLRRKWEESRATGKTPKSYQNNGSGAADAIAAAFHP